MHSILNPLNRRFNELHDNHSLVCVNAIKTVIKNTGDYSVKSSKSDFIVKSIDYNNDYNYTRLGSDSHADISCAGSDAKIICYLEGRQCTVHTYNDSYKPKKNVRICDAAFAYDTTDGQTYILRINQCLDFTKEMKHSLFSSNQVRSNGIIVDDVPLKIDVLRTSKQAMIIPGTDEIVLPFKMHGPVPYLPVRSPSQNEMDECKWIELTSDEIWDPEQLLGDDYKLSSISTSVQDPDDYLLLKTNVIISAVSHTSKGVLTPELLSQMWNISLKSAKRTLLVTSHHSVKTTEGSLTRRRRVAYTGRINRQLGGYLSQFASDTFMSNVTSLRGNRCIQLFCNRGGYVKSYGMKTKGESHQALQRFIDEVGVPTEILTDGAKELTMGSWGKICKRNRIAQPTTEPYSPWQNPAELNGGITKRRVRHLMKITNSPIRIWDYCWEYVNTVKTCTAIEHFMLDGLTPYEKVHSHSPNITELIQYHWFDWLWYYNPEDVDKEKIGRWLGPATHVGDVHTSYILSSTGIVITRSTTRPVTQSELESPEVVRRMKDYTTEMESNIGNYATSTMRAHEEYGDDPFENIFNNDDFVDDDYLPQELNDSGEPVTTPNMDDLAKPKPQ